MERRRIGCRRGAGAAHETRRHGEGLYDGSSKAAISAFGILNPDKKPGDDKPAFLFNISIPAGLSILATHSVDGFVPGINDLIEGRAVTPMQATP